MCKRFLEKSKILQIMFISQIATDRYSKLRTPRSKKSNSGRKTKKAARMADKLIVWDEFSMAHKGGLKALDTSPGDIRNCNKVFGGLTVLICGDQQILPVVTKGTPTYELKVCAKSSHLWGKVSVMTLRRNMSAHITGNPKAG